MRRAQAKLAEHCFHLGLRRHCGQVPSCIQGDFADRVPQEGHQRPCSLWSPYQEQSANSVDRASLGQWNKFRYGKVPHADQLLAGVRVPVAVVICKKLCSPGQIREGKGPGGSHATFWERGAVKGLSQEEEDRTASSVAVRCYRHRRLRLLRRQR